MQVVVRIRSAVNADKKRLSFKNMDYLLMEILLEEEEDDDLLLLMVTRNKRESEKEMYKRRTEEGYSYLPIIHHLNGDNEVFRQFFRLNREQFNFVLSHIGNSIKKTPSKRIKSPISAEEKLFLCLRFIATGETFRSLSLTFRISAGYISIIIREVLKALCETLLPMLLPEPKRNDFEKISENFYNKCNFPNCCGAIDGKHIRVTCPKKTGSLSFNYKNYISIVLFATVDANCKFITMDVGSYGDEGDCAIFEKSNLGHRIRRGTYDFPPEKNLPSSDIVVPHVVVGDEAFRLDKRLMKPYTKNQALVDNSKSVFNYRLCQARRVSDNAFALLAHTFRIFQNPIAVLPETTDLIVTAACCLHNMLRDGFLENNNQAYYQYSAEIQLPKQNMMALTKAGGFANQAGFEIRDKFKSYFNSAQGSIE